MIAPAALARRRLRELQARRAAYRLERLALRRQCRKRLAVPRVPHPPLTAPNDTSDPNLSYHSLGDGRTLLGITVAHHHSSEAVIVALEGIIGARGQPQRLSLDDGGEFRSRAFDAWGANRGIALAFLQSRKRVQNAHLESFNARVRDECLSELWFLSVADARRGWMGGDGDGVW